MLLATTTLKHVALFGSLHLSRPDVALKRYKQSFEDTVPGSESSQGAEGYRTNCVPGTCIADCTHPSIFNLLSHLLLTILLHEETQANSLKYLSVLGDSGLTIQAFCSTFFWPPPVFQDTLPHLHQWVGSRLREREKERERENGSSLSLIHI